MHTHCRLLDYNDRADAGLLLGLLDAYAQDPMGGGKPLPEATHAGLAELLASTPGAFSVVAECAGTATGLANCFTTVSTFAARRLVNVHDVYVTPSARGNGTVDTLFAAIEQEARQLNACKITLEVLEGNARAQAVYRRLGFAGYSLDDTTGSALFWQRSLA